MFKRTIVSIALLFAGMTGVQAAPLGLTLLDTPDIVSGFINVAYDASTDSLTADGFALELDDGSFNNIAGGLFTLNATIGDSGNLTGGSLTIGGTAGAYNSGTLLTGDLTAFGFRNSGGDPLEFLFTVTGGDLAALYGATGGIILSQSGFGGDWSINWAGTGIAVADTAAVPLPGAVWLMLTALASLGAARRR